MKHAGEKANLSLLPSRERLQKRRLPHLLCAENCSVVLQGACTSYQSFAQATRHALHNDVLVLSKHMQNVSLASPRHSVHLVNVYALCNTTHHLLDVHTPSCAQPIGRGQCNRRCVKGTTDPSNRRCD